ncbi:MAG: hypothetical protein NC548_54210 [Lachnospiraceae bacterium]|nr:hypothetical protein [Lachnospiraceae bacterium]
MKIGALQDHCGNCKLISYCTEPFETPHLCVYEELEYVDEETYIQIAENITKEEIQNKLRQYEENNSSPWDNDYNGAICDIVLEKLERNEGNNG